VSKGTGSNGDPVPVTSGQLASTGGTVQPLEDYKPPPTAPGIYDLVGYTESKAIKKAVATRLRRLQRQELRTRQTRITTPAWSSQPIPGLVMALRSSGRDAFGTARAISELDTAMRRANSLLDDLQTGEDVTSWPMPTRPERCGLLLLDAGPGSLETLWTVYGVLVTAATSTPVSLASLASLAWSTSSSARRIASRWRLRRLYSYDIDQRPRANATVDSADELGTWQERTTKSLVPALELAMHNRTGLDYRATGPGGELRIIVLPPSDEGGLVSSV
jgi:hypothetical protein